MKLDKNSLRFKITFPVFIVSIGLLLFILLTSNKLLGSVIKEYHSLFVARQSFEIKKIFEKAIAELSVAQLIHHELVVEAKKMDVLEEIKLYWSNNNFEGIIKTTDEIIYSSIVPADTLISQIKDKEHFFFDYKNKHLHGFIVYFPAWDWQVITLAEPEISKVQEQITLLVPLIFFGFIAIIGSVFFILHKKLSSPIDSIINNIRNSNEISKTGIAELDIIGSAVNDAFNKLNKKTAQYLTLHNIAISLYEQSSIDQTLNLILDHTSRLINSEVALVGLYDDSGKFKKILAKGADFNDINRMPEGRGILQLVRLSIAPLRIDNVLEHPAFSGSFPEGHPIIRNLLAYPILSSQGKSLGALFFGNKEGGFSEEDELLLKAVSADALIAIEKAESLSQLQRFRQIIESAFDVVVITNQDGYIIYANPAFEAVTGYLKEEAIGKKLNILKSGYHDENFYKTLWNTLKAGKVWQGEFINKKKSGEIYYESATIFPIYLEEELCYVAIKKDITKEKKLYEQLLRAQKMEAIGTLAGGIAHDFNNILTAVLGYSDIMLRMTKEGDPFYRPASIINTAAKKGADLAKKILMITRKDQLETRTVNINEIIRNSLELLERSIPKNIEIVLNLKENIPNIMADPSQIQQVIMNLAVNARDAMPDGGRLTIETSVVEAENGSVNSISSDKGEFLKLSISDTGIGMDLDTQRKIFDPFFTTKEPGKGTGLGLYIVHSIISNHNGFINLYSEPGKGTRFNIYLPITKAAPTEKFEEDIDIRGTETILIIDDEPHIREMCKDILEPYGYKVLVAESGTEGIKIFKNKKDEISLVILDMIMPKMGGSEVFQALRTIKPDAKIVICSGYSHEGFAGINNLLQNGAVGFIQKPFTRQSIALAIKKALSA